MRPCPVCGDETHTNFFHRDFRGMSEIVPFSSYEVVQCDRGGMMFVGNIMETMPLSAYYALMSKYETVAYAVSTELNDVKQSFGNLLLKDIAPQASVLDVGCGEGSLLRFLKAHGIQKVAGLEPSRKNCESLQERWGIRAICGALGEGVPELAGETFDFIILDSVLEHLLPVQEDLQQLLHYLAPYGKLCFVVPNLTAFPDIHDLYQQFSVEHVNYFTLQSMTNLMRGFGMRCINYGTAGEGLYTLWQHSDMLPPMQYDEEGVQSMKRYLAQAKALSEDIRQKLEPYRGQDVYIWAAGTHTAMLYQLGLLDGIHVRAIIDSNANYQGKTIYSVPVIAPEDLYERETLPIIISSQLAQGAICTQITERMGLRNEIVTLYGENQGGAAL